ncbi:UvrD-helicase domain-containing protein [Candidatus Uhrbacteria bacterium]|nr:UvrD-helicase domain-containing protein [Candidatus Uhrbacteria bacterium]
MKEFVLSGAGFGSRKIDYAAELNDEQREPVVHGDGATLVLAGAGSGKTRVITYRVAWLLEQGVPPERILLLTFTNKAAREMVSRVEALLGVYPHGLWAGTFHSIANRILRMYGSREGFAPNFSILDEEDAGDLIKLCTKHLKIDTAGKRFPSPNVLKGVISYRRNAAMSMEDVLSRKHPHLLPMLADIERVADMYERQKAEQQAMDFDDLLTVLLRLLRNHPDVREKLADQFAYILVDEFQDTNVIQADIVHALAGTHGNILAVGDDAQSIYSFRAAEIRNILDFPRRYPDAKVFRLVTNYRSTPQILAIANSVIAHNENQFAKELVAAVHDGERPQLVPANSASQEAQFVVEQICALLDEGAAPSSVAVLFRAAFHSQQVEFELMKRGIPYEYRGGMKFFERAHVKDALAHLRTIHNVKDLMAWNRALTLQPGLGLTTANKIATTLAQAATIDEAVASTPVTAPKARAGWEGTQRMLRAMLAARPSVADVLRAFAASDDYRAYLEGEYPNWRERLDDVEQLAVFAEQYQELGGFLDAVSLTAEFGARIDDPAQPEDEAEGDALVLSTIHQAKGLEWDTVFIINLSEGGFPSGRALDEEGGLEEERRLFYVAATRARKKLFLTYPITAGYEHVELRQPSTFLTEIPKHELEEVRLRYGGSWQATQEHRRGPRTPAWDDEPTIVLDDDGERVTKPAPKSFLRDLDDL